MKTSPKFNNKHSAAILFNTVCSISVCCNSWCGGNFKLSMGFLLSRSAPKWTAVAMPCKVNRTARPVSCRMVFESWAPNDFAVNFTVCTETSLGMACQTQQRRSPVELTISKPPLPEGSTSAYIPISEPVRLKEVSLTMLRICNGTDESEKLWEPSDLVEIVGGVRPGKTEPQRWERLEMFEFRSLVHLALNETPGISWSPSDRPPIAPYA